MSLRHTVSRTLDRMMGIEPLYAHCDVPCGIYDPHLAGVAAKTVNAMVKKVQDLPSPTPQSGAHEVLEYRNTVIRMVQTKEQMEILAAWALPR